MKPRIGRFLPTLCAFLLGVVALGAAALGCLVSANDALTFGDANAQGSGSLFAIALVCGAGAIAIRVWLGKRPK